MLELCVTSVNFVPKKAKKFMNFFALQNRVFCGGSIKPINLLIFGRGWSKIKVISVICQINI